MSEVWLGKVSAIDGFVSKKTMMNPCFNVKVVWDKRLKALCIVSKYQKISVCSQVNNALCLSALQSSGKFYKVASSSFLLQNGTLVTQAHDFSAAQFMGLK